MSMRVTIMGHAGLFVEAGPTRILLDPILHGRPIASGAVRHLHPRELVLDAMPIPTALVVTHGHLDHFDPPSLERIDRKTPVWVPEDESLIRGLRAMGFESVTVLGAFESFQQGGLRVTATPSGAEIDEFGVLFEHDGARFWHMSDAESTPDVGERIAGSRGVDLLSAKYQPTAHVQGQVFRSLGATFDKSEIIEWLETACAARPRAVFPYASGIVFDGRFAWNNRYAFPYNEVEIAELLERRLGAPGAAHCVRAGDILEVAPSSVQKREATSPFVRSMRAREPMWEPFEASALVGLDTPAERTELTERVKALLPRLLKTWLVLGEHGPLAHFLEYGVIYQLAIHLGGGERLVYSVDFGAEKKQLRHGPHGSANYFAHVGARSLLDVLRGDAGAELFHAGGDLRIHEKILTLRGGRFWAPPHQGWALYDLLPEPLTWYLRHAERYQLMAA